MHNHLTSEFVDDPKTGKSTIRIILGLKTGKTSTPGVLIPTDMMGADHLKTLVLQGLEHLSSYRTLGINPDEVGPMVTVRNWCLGDYTPETGLQWATFLRLPFLLAHDCIEQLDSQISAHSSLAKNYEYDGGNWWVHPNGPPSYMIPKGYDIATLSMTDQLSLASAQKVYLYNGIRKRLRTLYRDALYPPTSTPKSGWASGYQLT